MDSRLLDKLNAQASIATDPVVWARAVCRAASHFARHGKTDKALRAIEVVRGQFGKNLQFEIASWLMLAEGTLHYFNARFYEAYDRMQRAYGLAIALRTHSALPSCAAWMAQFEFNDCKYDAMVSHLDQALEKAEYDDHQAIARLSLVMGLALHFCGQFERARPWYDRARISAVSEGDNATVSAVFHNIATLKASNLRLDDIQDIDVVNEGHRVSLEAISSFTYDSAIGHEGLDFLTPMLKGLTLTIEKKYEEALPVFEGIDYSKVIKRSVPVVQVDHAWCMVNTGAASEANEIAELALAGIQNVSDDDDLTYVYGRLRQIARHTGDLSRAEEYGVKSEMFLKLHRDFQSALLEKISAIERPPKTKNPT